MKRLLFVVLVIAAAAAPAYAHRDGVTFGGGVGVGTIDCDGADCSSVNTAGGLMLHLGGMVAPDAAILADAWGMLRRDDSATFSQGMLMGAVRFWPIQRLWLGGGIGIARAEWSYDTGNVLYVSRTAWVPAAMLNLGVELVSNRDFSLDLELRGGTGFYSQDDVRVRNLLIGVGVNFF
ncbi:MAG TPA: outer membrane beta-barrel protein [Haliangiales bacterium]|nr:outer membrane beta-barrel protein [Haliangiales bacterium]